jgi:hypothetical protein
LAAARNAGGKSRAQRTESEAPESTVKPLLKKPANARPTKLQKSPTPLKSQKPPTALKPDARKAKPRKDAAPRKAKSDRPVVPKPAPASAKGRQKPPPLHPVERLEPEGERLIAALQRHPAPWATRRQLGLEEKRADPVVKRLIAAGRIVSVGKLDQSEAYALAQSNDAAACLESLAARTLADLARPGKLDLLPLAEKDERYRGIPVGVRGAIVARLTRQVSERDAFPVQVGKASFVALAEGLRTLVGVAPQNGKSAGVPSARRASPTVDRHSVVRAYQQLSSKRRSPNIVVSELQRESGVDLAALQSWLLGECRAHRAVPLLGEPAHATAEQLAAALVVEGRPHLYVRLVHVQPS